MELVVEKYFTLIIGSHFFKILNPTPRIISILYRFAGKYQQRAWVKEAGKKPQFKVVKTYAAKTYDGSEFRFHIGQLKDFYEHLHFNNVDSSLYETITLPMFDPVKIGSKLNPGWVLKDYQQAAVEFVTKEESNDNHSRLLSMPTGTGKAQPLTSLIKTPNGWITMSDVEVGTVISTPDGAEQKVTGVYPQGKKDIYRVTFEDGRSTECCLEHLWKVTSKTDSIKDCVLSTERLMYLMSTEKYYDSLYIDLINDTTERNLIKYNNLYDLGILFGSNCLCSDSDVKLRDPYKKLTFCCGRNSNQPLEKRFYSFSNEQCQSFLQGFLDSNCRADIKTGQIFTSSVDYELAVLIQYLVRNLGGKAVITSLVPNSLGNCINNKNLIAYTVEITHPNPKNLFRLSFNRELLRSKFSTQLLKLKNIEHIGVKEAQCISVDSEEKLYVTDSFIVTHNTVTAMAASSVLGDRTLIVLLPAYIEKTASDICNILNVKPKEVMVVQGSDNLKSIIALGKENLLEAKYIILSVKTIQNFYKTYESDTTLAEADGFQCKPDELCETLKVGTVIIDETHQHLHAVFKFLLYSHVNKVIALSATLITQDPFIEKIHKLMFPMEKRYEEVKMKKYIKVYPINYSFLDIKQSKIRTSEFGSNTYSHIAFEKSILRNKVTTGNYMKLIEFLIKIGYVKEYIKGDKLAIFASSISMCDVIVAYLTSRFPEYDIRRYVEEDPYENVIEADIRVTTILSAGTAVDIPNLRTVILTSSINSPVSNLQTLGRLRELPDRDVKFYYMFSPDIPKQKDYHNNKMELFRDRVASIKEFRSPIAI